MSETASILAEHYQKTFELTYEYWKERNRLFLFLVGTIGLALMLVLKVSQADSLLLFAIAKFLGITDPDQIAILYRSFPFNVLQSMFLVVIFYLMQKLYSSNLSVMRNYQYLGAMETEVRQSLNLPGKSVSFTREGSFYWDSRTRTQNLSKWFYIVVIALMLITFLAAKLIDDGVSKNIALLVIDLAIAIPTGIYFWEYARSALALDKPNTDVKKANAKKR